MKTHFDCLLVHVPKLENRYRPLGDTLYVKSMAIGLLAMADHLERAGLSCQVIHCGVEKVLDPGFDLGACVKEASPRVVGFSLHWHPQSFDTIEAARHVKETNPGVFVLLGGLTASFYADELVRTHAFIDGVIRGDGEVPLTLLLRELGKRTPRLDSVSNLVWRCGDQVVTNDIDYVADEKAIDDLEYFNYNLMRNNRFYIDVFGRSPANYMKHVSPRLNTIRRSTPSFIVPVARGCSANCKWCGGSRHAHALTSGRRRYAYRSIERILEDIDKARKQGFGIAHFAHFSHPREDEYYLRLFKAMRERHVDVAAYFECSTLPTRRLADAFEETFRSRMAESVLCLSRMSPNEEVRRRNVGHFYTNKELKDMLEYIDGKGIPIELTFTLGLPGEVAEDVPRLAEFRKHLLRKFKNVRSSVVLTSQIEPGSSWCLHPESFGIVSDQSSFGDYYRFNSGSNSYYTHLGYYVKDYFGSTEANDIEEFRKRIQRLRCRQFCLLSGNSTRPWANLVGRAKCAALDLGWRALAIAKRGSWPRSVGGPIARDARRA